ncbi:MAG: hypothetical protein JKY31_13540 [Rhodobacteraceae bacterium]|nr:hypothetical protein [Paracoccaceae bacterium]
MTDGYFPDKDLKRTVSEIRRAGDFDDLQNELAGRETGRNQRFLGKGNTETQEARRRKPQDQLEQTLLQLLLQNDPIYAVQYGSVMDLLGRAETVTDIALAQAEADLALAQEAVSMTLDRANKLPDGTAIFKDRNGSVWTADGQLLKGDDLEGVFWNASTPSYEDYLKHKKAADGAQYQMDALRLYQVDVLGKSRDLLTDPDNPSSLEELEELKKRIEENAPQSIKASISAEIEVPTISSQKIDNLDIPKL